ncbi:MAG: hypothetical protein OXU26_12160 [Acidobacteriota bacterium]|nr:hypothetical protein [Acidobacteriota bacterium]MDE2964660.1 hypothetical protein [Acidobacteriota bacterium]
MAAWALLLPVAEGLHARAIDYLSPEEIEKVRDSQEPHRRMSVLNDIFKRRMEGAMASWDASEAEDGGPRAQSRRQGKESAEPVRSLSFRGWMKEVAMCLEDIETNLESYPLDRPLSVWDLETGRPIRMNYKKFRKALKKLRKSLTEFDRWLAPRLDRVERAESRLAEEVAEILSDLDEALEETIELAGGVIDEKGPARRRARP